MAKKKDEEAIVTDDLLNVGKEEAEETNADKAGAEVNQTDVDALIAELEKAGVTNTEQLQNKLSVTKEYGNVVNQLGDARAEIRQLREMLQSGQQKRRVDDFGMDNTSQDVDLAGLINKVMEERDIKKARQQQEYSKAVVATWNKIQNDQDYGLIKEVWEKKMSDPNFVFMIQNGQVNAIDEYHNTVREYYKGIAKRSVETIKTLAGGSKIKAPHVESGNARVPGMKVNDDKTAQQEKIEELTDKVNKGKTLTIDEELDALMASLTK